MNQSDKTKQTWKTVKDNMTAIEVYTVQETIDKLKKDDLYRSLEGKAKNRTLMKKDLRLYKSIIEHTNQLEHAFTDQNAYKTNYNFSHRIRFLVERNLDLESLKCNCKKKYTWTTYCRHCPEYKRNQLGKPHTEDTKKKMRLSALKYIKELKGQVVPRYNRDAIAIIEDYGQRHGYNFIHAENGGEYFIKELGYFLDGYDLINNIAIEIDEKRHFKDGLLLQKDTERQKQIENLLGCLLYTSPSPRDRQKSRMPSSA